MNQIANYKSHIETKLEHFRTALNDRCFDGLLIASGHAEDIFRDDYYHQFVVNPYFKEWLPLLNVPHCYLLIEASGRPKLFFYKPEDIWHRVESIPQEPWLQQFELFEFSAPELLQKELELAPGSLAFIGPQADAVYAACESSEINPDSLMAWIDYQRAYKSLYEIECVAEANRMAAKAHKAAEGAFMDGASEYHINQAYTQAVLAREQTLPYGNIIALNENAAILHYTHLDTEEAKPSKSFLIDAGFSVNGYCADISRSYCRDESESGKHFQQLIEEMDTLQLQLVSEAVPGCEFVDLHLRMHELLTEVLIRQGVITVSADVALAGGLSSIFLPHGLGHLLGVQVHDRGGWFADVSGKENPPPKQHPYLRLTRPLAEGMVFTIEPGLYFIPALLKQLKASDKAEQVDWSVIETLLPYGGIRIEDDIAIVDGRVRNLSREAFAGS